jgi:uncharacterized membrane protein YhhN
VPTTVILASVMAGAVASLLHAIRVGDRTQEVASKTAASISFVVLGFARWSPGNPVDTWLITALVLCAVGDICLLWARSFDFGLISFLLGHLAYVIGFVAAARLQQWPILLLVPLVAAAGFVLKWLWPHLGGRRTSVTAYVVAITVMVWGGSSTFFNGVLPWTAAVGALLFYFSDLAVARHRFVHEDFINRTVGLPIYYLGQLLLAMTIGAG